MGQKKKVIYNFWRKVIWINLIQIETFKHYVCRIGRAEEEMGSVVKGQSQEFRKGGGWFFFRRFLAQISAASLLHRLSGLDFLVQMFVFPIIDVGVTIGPKIKIIFGPKLYLIYFLVRKK